MWNSIVEFFTPVRGSLAFIGSFLASIFPSITHETQTLILFLFQLLAACVGIMVGIATIYNLHLKWRDRKEARKAKRNETL